MLWIRVLHGYEISYSSPPVSAHIFFIPTIFLQKSFQSPRYPLTAWPHPHPHNADPHPHPFPRQYCIYFMRSQISYFLFSDKNGMSYMCCPAELNGGSRRYRTHGTALILYPLPPYSRRYHTHPLNYYFRFLPFPFQWETRYRSTLPITTPVQNSTMER